MIQPFRAVSLLFLATLFAGGVWVVRPGHAQFANDLQSADHHEVSQKVWVTQQEIQNRYPLARHMESCARRSPTRAWRASRAHRRGVRGGIADRKGQVMGEGSNHVVSEFDPTWHGEMEAIRNACKRMKVLKLDGCVLYTSSEPCPMCLATAYWAGLDGVVYGADVADSKKYGGFDDGFIYEQFAKPPSSRSISQTQLLRDEAVKVWKDMPALPATWLTDRSTQWVKRPKHANYFMARGSERSAARSIGPQLSSTRLTGLFSRFDR